MEEKKELKELQDEKLDEVSGGIELRVEIDTKQKTDEFNPTPIPAPGYAAPSTGTKY